MPRGPRIDIPGLTNHVMCRGIEKKDIFKDDKDYKEFLERISKLSCQEDIKVYAFCLMPNHVHLLVRPLRMPLATFMRRLLTGYAIYFNRRHKRVGHLFQNRYKSYIVEEDSYLLELIRYIHLNPIRAGIIPDLNRLAIYPYTGYSALMGRQKHGFLEAGDVLSHFSGNMKAAREKLSLFMQDGISSGKRDDLAGGGLNRSLEKLSYEEKRARQAYDERILGSGLFVETILNEIEKSASFKKKNISLGEILEKVARHYRVTVAELCSGSKRPTISKARYAAIFLGVKEAGIQTIELSDALGIGTTAIYEIVNSGRGKEESRGIILE